MTTQPDMFADFDPSAPAPELLTGYDVITEGDAGSWATFSACRAYRYVLGRQWEPLAPWMVICMLNPSKADASEPDPTITRVLGFAKRDHFGGILAVNAFALRATDPRKLRTAVNPVGHRNNEAIENAIGRPLLAKAVAAWGVPKWKFVRGRCGQLSWLMGRSLWTLGPRTKGGYPRHPLYLRADTPIIEWGT